MEIETRRQAIVRVAGSRLPEFALDKIEGYVKQLWEYIEVFDPPNDRWGTDHDFGVLPVGYIADSTLEKWIAWAIKYPILEEAESEESWSKHFGKGHCIYNSCKWEQEFWKLLLKSFTFTSNELEEIERSDHRIV